MNKFIPSMNYHTLQQEYHWLPSDVDRQFIPSVNYHMLQPCDMECRHCFSKNLSIHRLQYSDAVKLVRMLAPYFKKINFAGGETMLYPNLDVLIQTAKKCGMTTSIVTNGTRITSSWLANIAKHLDWIALSIDSVYMETHKQMGRAAADGPLSTEKYLEICHAIKESGIHLKINTVVTALNKNETMRDFIIMAQPDRWKILQMLLILGQNDKVTALAVTDAEFKAYVERNRHVKGVTVVPESNDLMTGSYIMIDPLGRFFDNTTGTHRYSRPILDVGVEEALSDVDWSPEKFEKRGGNYDWRRDIG